MTNTRVTQGHKVLVVGGTPDGAPAQVTQGHKILVVGGSAEGSPAAVLQAHMVLLYCPDRDPPPVPKQANFMSFIP